MILCYVKCDFCLALLTNEYLLISKICYDVDGGSKGRYGEGTTRNNLPLKWALIPRHLF